MFSFCFSAGDLLSQLFRGCDQDCAVGYKEVSQWYASDNSENGFRIDMLFGAYGTLLVRRGKPSRVSLVPPVGLPFAGLE